MSTRPTRDISRIRNRETTPGERAAFLAHGPKPPTPKPPRDPSKSRRKRWLESGGGDQSWWAQQKAKPATGPADFEAWTDGACVPNPGPGGFGAVIVDLYDGTSAEVHGPIRQTTNNRAELIAVIEALRATPPGSRVEVVTDSKYVMTPFQTGSIERVRRQGWTRKNSPLINADLWGLLYAEVEIRAVSWRWVRGHTGVPLNERADRLAERAAVRARYL